jgi:O-antigen ligase
MVLNRFSFPARPFFSSSLPVANLLDNGIRFFLYVLIFWLPYSPAVVESCVITALVLWLIKRIIFAVVLSRRLSIGQALRKAFVLRMTPLNQPILWFVIVCFLSALASPAGFYSFRGFLTKTVEWFVVYFLVVEVMTKRSHVMTALGILLVTAFATCLDGIYQELISRRDIFYGRVMEYPGATAAFKTKNSLGAFLTLVIPVTAGLCLRPLTSKWLKILLGACLFFGIWTAFLTYSRGAWVAVVLGLFFFAWQIIQNKNFKKILLGSLAVVLVVAGLYFQDKGNIRNTTNWRAGLWSESWEMIKARPVLGFGPNTFMGFFQLYRQRSSGVYDFDPTYAHNCFLQVTAETGVAGLITFCWILKNLLQNLLKKQITLGSDRGDIILIGGMAAGLAAFLAHSFVDVHFFSLRLVVLFWTVAGLSMAFHYLLQVQEIYDINDSIIK